MAHSIAPSKIINMASIFNLHVPITVIHLSENKKASVAEFHVFDLDIYLSKMS